MEPVLFLHGLFQDHFITMGEHKAQLWRAKAAHKADLHYMAGVLNEEIIQATVRKWRKLGEAKNALDRAARALAKRRP